MRIDEFEDKFDDWELKNKKFQKQKDVDRRSRRKGKHKHQDFKDFYE